MDHRDLRLTESARELLELARDEAERFRHEYVGTEHLVLAFTRQRQGSARKLLLDLGIDLDHVRRTTEGILQPGSASPSSDRPRSYTSRAKRVFVLARESAVAVGQADVSAEHLLIGLLREATGIGAQVLRSCGLSADAAADGVSRIDRVDDREPP